MALVADACYGQPRYVEVGQSERLPYGLFSVVDFSAGDGPYWQQGVEYEPYKCGPAGVYACPTCVQNNAGTAPAKTYETGIPLVQSFPFTVYGSFKCSPVGNWDRAVERAQAHLETGEERAVELEIARNNVHTGLGLTAAGATNITPTPGTPVTVQQGIALLESYIGANSNGSGVILGNRRDVTLANSAGQLIIPSDSRLHTILGTPVAALSGFDGKTGPNNVAAAAGNAWLFATGKIHAHRSEVFTPADRSESLKTATNDLEVLAERTYEISWECFTAGVLVTSV